MFCLLGVSLALEILIMFRKKGKTMNIYVGNLSAQVTEDMLKQEFAAFGQVESVTIIKDKFSGESRGFGFVVMPSSDEAQKAIAGLNNKDVGGKNLNVSEARPKVPKFRGGGRGGSGGGRGGRGGPRGGGRGDRPPRSGGFGGGFGGGRDSGGRDY